MYRCSYYWINFHHYYAVKLLSHKSEGKSQTNHLIYMYCMIHWFAFITCVTFIGKVVIKFCNMGFVTSRKWTAAYLTIVDGIVRLYDSIETCPTNSQNSALNIVLGNKHQASLAKKKNYSKDPMKVIEFFCFYIQIDNGVLLPTRLLKIGSPDPGLIENIIRCIDIHTDSVPT